MKPVSFIGTCIAQMRKTTLSWTRHCCLRQDLCLCIPEVELWKYEKNWGDLTQQDAVLGIIYICHSWPLNIHRSIDFPIKICSFLRWLEGDETMPGDQQTTSESQWWCHGSFPYWGGVEDLLSKCICTPHQLIPSKAGIAHVFSSFIPQYSQATRRRHRNLLACFVMLLFFLPWWFFV